MSAFLAIDSSTAHLCLSLVFDGKNHDVKQLDFCEEVGRDHAKRMIPEIDLLISSAGLEKRDLTAIAVGVGPGSYTGVRVAVATGKGLARALSIPLYSSPTLEALAVTAKTQNPNVIATMDARREHVYAASYHVGNDQARLTSEIEKISNTELEHRIEAQNLYLVQDAIPNASYIAKQAKLAFEAKQAPTVAHAIYL